MNPPHLILVWAGHLFPQWWSALNVLSWKRRWLGKMRDKDTALVKSKGALAGSNSVVNCISWSLSSLLSSSFSFCRVCNSFLCFFLTPDQWLYLVNLLLGASSLFMCLLNNGISQSFTPGPFLLCIYPPPQLYIFSTFWRPRIW